MGDEANNPARRNWHSPVLRSFLRHESFLKRFIRRYLPQQEDVDDHPERNRRGSVVGMKGPVEELLNP